jgi:hypothetical protein
MRTDHAPSDAAHRQPHSGAGRSQPSRSRAALAAERDRRTGRAADKRDDHDGNQHPSAPHPPLCRGNQRIEGERKARKTLDH